MRAQEIREKYLKFFKTSPRNHTEISPAPLVLEGDPTTLFTSAGMQPLVPYLLGKPHPTKAKRLVNYQPCLRTVDIEEVGDNRHTTFFEMLGNWSLGDYFKKEQLPWIWEFLTKKLGIDPEKLYVTCFEGNKEIPKDTESAGIWQKIGIPKSRIGFFGTKENWWSRSGPPNKMPVGEIGGPASEVFYEFTQVKHDPRFGKECHPNCDCGRFLEIGNSVFIEYTKTENGLKVLPQKNVDFGGGLERLTAAVNNDPDVFKIDLFEPLIKRVEEVSAKAYRKNDSAMRVIVDHVRASEALILEGISPSNKFQGYVLRRLIRRAAIKMHTLKGVLAKTDLNLTQDQKVNGEIEREVSKFTQTLEKGLQQIKKIKTITAKQAFDLYQNFGFPFEITQELFSHKGQKLDKAQFEKEFEKHKELSRTTSAGIFKGGLADTSEETKKLHTATHLLHAALRKVLGEHVSQKGSHITTERLRFDFSHPKKLNEEEIKRIELLVNKQIARDLPVSCQEMSLEEALKDKALAFFKGKYSQKVKVFSIGKFSKEVCAGPHVSSTAKIGRVTIVKQESVGTGLRRIYAKLGKK